MPADPLTDRVEVLELLVAELRADTDTLRIDSDSTRAQVARQGKMLIELQVEQRQFHRELLGKMNQLLGLMEQTLPSVVVAP